MNAYFNISSPWKPNLSCESKKGDEMREAFP